MSRIIPRRRSRLALLAAPVLALAVGCGSSGTTTSTSASTLPARSSAGQSATYPVTVEGSNGSVSINAQPKRIVSLSPADTEILWSVGAGPQVVAVDDQSDYP